jgi:hypothetical protein
MVHSEGPLFGFGLGFHHARQVVLPFEMTAALPSVALRVGRQNGLHAYASFGDFGSFAETSGDLQLGLGVSPLPLLKVWTGVTAELSPSYGYEVGVLWHALRTLGVALVGGVSPLDGQQYQSIMVGLEWRDEHDLPTSWQGE